MKEQNQAKTVYTDATKERIIKESVKLFANKGYAATSIKDISKAANVNIAAVNYHFTNKENLYKQLLSSFATRNTSTVQRILKPPTNKEEFKVRLEMFLSSGLDNIIDCPDLPRMLMKNIDLMPQISEETFHKTFEQFHQTLVEFFKSAQKNGIVRKDLDHRIVAQFIDNQLFAFVHKVTIEKNLKKDVNDPAFRAQWLDQTLALFFGGVLEKGK